MDHINSPTQILRLLCFCLKKHQDNQLRTGIFCGDDEVTLKQSQTDFPHFLGGVDACHPDSHIANNKTWANLGLLCDGVKVEDIPIFLPNTLPETNSSPLKMVVGRQASFWGPAYFAEDILLLGWVVFWWLIYIRLGIEKDPSQRLKTPFIRPYSRAGGMLWGVGWLISHKNSLCWSAKKINKSTP